jgi:hypothetical protein
MIYSRGAPRDFKVSDLASAFHTSPAVPTSRSEDHRLMGYLAHRNIPYFVLPSSTDGDSGVPQISSLTHEIEQNLPESPASARFTPIIISYDVIDLAAPCQTLYRLNIRRCCSKLCGRVRRL